MHKEGVVSCYCACAVHSLGSDEVPRVKDYYMCILLTFSIITLARIRQDNR